MSPEASTLMDKARRSVHWAQAMLAEGSVDFSASHAYYAMFYLAEAMLMVRGLSYSKHSAIIAGFGREFSKSDRAWQAHHQHLTKAFDMRQRGDYGDLGAVSEAEARDCIEWAREFLAMAEDWLERNDVPEADAD